MACISLPTAALIGGGLSAAGGLASAFIGSNAATSAANTQAQAAANAQAQTMQMFKTIQQNLQPFQQAGSAALPGLENLLGLGSNGTAGILTQLQQTPGYQFALQQGLQATQNSYAAQGLGQSGAALKGAANYAEGLAGTTYNNVFNNFLSTAGLGVGATEALGNFASGTQSSINQLIGTQAAAQAAGTVGSANAISGGISNALGGISQAALLMGLNSSGMFGGNSSVAGGINSTYLPSAALGGQAWGG